MTKRRAEASVVGSSQKKKSDENGGTQLEEELPVSDWHGTRREK